MSIELYQVRTENIEAAKVRETDYFILATGVIEAVQIVEKMLHKDEHVIASMRTVQMTRTTHDLYRPMPISSTTPESVEERE